MHHAPCERKRGYTPRDQFRTSRSTEELGSCSCSRGHSWPDRRFPRHTIPASRHLWESPSGQDHGGLAISDHGFRSSGSPCELPSSLCPTTLRSAKIPGHRRREDDAGGVTLLDHMRSQTFRRESLLPVFRKPSMSLLGRPVYTGVHERPCRVASFGSDP